MRTGLAEIEIDAMEAVAFERACGGWLVVTRPDAFVRIGVTGATKESARARMAVTLEKWAAILNDGERPDVGATEEEQGSRS